MAAICKFVSAFRVLFLTRTSISTSIVGSPAGSFLLSGSRDPEFQFHYRQFLAHLFFFFFAQIFRTWASAHARVSFFVAQRAASCYPSPFRPGPAQFVPLSFVFAEKCLNLAKFISFKPCIEIQSILYEN
jgi:hypothetical protein